MNQRYLLLLNDLLQGKGETSCVEFKRNNEEPDTIAKLCSALSNAARIEGQELAYVVWGVDNDSKQIVGTNFYPESKTVGNQVFRLWLAQRLSPSIPVVFYEVEHPNGHVVILEIPAATSIPVSFDNIQYVRIGSGTPKLADYPEYLQKLITNLRPHAWEKGIAKPFATSDEVLALLDYSQYFHLIKHPLPDNRKGILEKLAAEDIITTDVGEHWNITNLGAILLARDLTTFGHELARKAVRFVVYQGNNRATTVAHRYDANTGYAVGFETLLTFIQAQLPHNEHIGTALRKTIRIYPDLAVRETIANAIIHQDMTVSGAGVMVELFSDRLEVTNPGKPLMNPDRMIDLPPRSRNAILASLMRRMGMCEEQGSGLDKVVIHIELHQLPPPKFYADADSLQVILYAPRSFADMSPSERLRACYQHAVIQYLTGLRMKNATLLMRLGIEARNAAQVSKVIKMAEAEGLIKAADPEHPRAGYVPFWV